MEISKQRTKLAKRVRAQVDSLNHVYESLMTGEKPFVAREVLSKVTGNIVSIMYELGELYVMEILDKKER